MSQPPGAQSAGGQSAGGQPPASEPATTQPGAGRPLRADAARNRARVLEAAYTAFASDGLTVPIDEIARRAGVGPGTVHRHFPTKEALIQAVVIDRMDRLDVHAKELATGAAPGDAFFGYLWLMIDEFASDKGLADALAGAGFHLETVAPGTEQRFKDTLRDLLTAAQQTGAVRTDIDVMDVKTLLVSVHAMLSYRGDSGATRRMIGLVFDGLRAGRS